MVLEINQNDLGKVSGVLLYVPQLALQSGFQIQDTKLRSIRCTSSSRKEYDGESLCRTLDGEPSWSEVTIRLISDNVLIARDKVAVDRRVGGVIRWRRIQRSNGGDLAHACYGKAQIAEGNGDLDEALMNLLYCVEHRPSDALFCNAIAWELATSRHDALLNPKAAVTAAEDACDLTSHQQPDYLDTLAAAYAAKGEFEKAVETQQKALTQAPIYARRMLEAELEEAGRFEKMEMVARLAVMNDPEAKLLSLYVGDISEFEARLRLYKAGKAYRE